MENTLGMRMEDRQYYSKTEIYLLFLPNFFDDLWRGHQEPRKELFLCYLMFYVGCDKNSYTMGEKKTHFLEINLLLNEQKYVTRGQPSQTGLSQFPYLLKYCNYSESNFDFTTWGNFWIHKFELPQCFKIIFSEKKKLNLWWHPVHFIEFQKQWPGWARRCPVMNSVMNSHMQQSWLTDFWPIRIRHGDTKWRNSFWRAGNWFQSKTLLLLVREHWSVPCWDAFVDRPFRLVSPHWIDIRAV